MPNCVSRVCEAFDSCEVLPLSPPAVMVAWGVVSTHAWNEKKAVDSHHELYTSSV